MRALSSQTWLRIACGLAVLGLAFMMWSLIDPRVAPVMIALTVGQGIGTLSLLLYIGVVVREYRARRKAHPEED